MQPGNISRKDLSEEDIKFRYITPAVENAGWSKNLFRFEFYYTAGKINVREGEAVRGKGKKVDYLLFYNTNTPLAVVEAKDANHEIAGGLQQAIDYARDLDVEFAYSSNGEGFCEHDLITGEERQIKMDEFPSPDDLWARYREESGLTDEQTKIITEPYYYDASYNIEPRYYQRIAINRTVEAVAKGQKRILLVMATGTGKTYMAFQIVHRLKRSSKVNRVLYLADRNILIDQTLNQDFKPFKKVAVKVENRKLDSAYEIYMSLYHQLADNEEDYYKQFSPDFFDLIIVDECHRSSARDNSNWHKILEYFSSAIQVGMTATPKETEDVSNIGYFGDPIYTYSLKQGIEDGYLAPYEVIKVGINKDLEGYRPEEGKVDVDGYEVIDREYTLSDFDKELIIDERTKVVAQRITKYLKQTDRMARTIVFCVDTEHASRMRMALAQENADMLESCRVTKIIVTVDGDRATHDATRHLKGGSPTYDRIMGNLEVLRTGMTIHVRCNVHANNVGCLDNLRKHVENIASRSGTSMRVVPAAVRENSVSAARGDTTPLVDAESFALVLQDFGEVERSHAFAAADTVCPLVRLNELYVDVRGQIYPSCHVIAGDDAYGLGNVSDEGPLDWDAAAQKLADDFAFPDDQPQCLACKLLPCCYGGCYATRYPTGEARCPELLADPDAYVLSLIDQ